MSRSTDNLNPAVNERTPLLPASAAASNGTAQSEVVLDAATKPARQVGPDALRGLLMLLMAFDHANVNFSTYPHGTSVHSEAASTPVTAFFTGIGHVLRLASHLCASGFALLLGFGLVYFVSSRAQRSWSARDQIGYIAKRALAILLVNEATFLPFTFTMHVWMLNIILPALAFDYLLIGLLVVGLDYLIQPALERRWQKTFSSTSTSPTTRASRKTGSPLSWLIDAFLTTLFFVAAFSTIWSAPNQGRCLATPPSKSAHVLAAPWLDAKCKPSASLIAQVLYLSEMCPNFGFISVFPPLAWISFVILGVVYARIVLRLRVKQAGLQALNVALGLVFALLFVSTRLLRYGNLSTDCLRTAAQQRQREGQNPYLASVKSFLYVTKYNPDPAFVFLTSSVNFLLLAFFGTLFAHQSAASTPTTTTTTASQHVLKAAQALKATLQTLLLTFGIQALFFYAFHQLLLAQLGVLLRAATPSLFVGRDPEVYPRPDGLEWGAYFVVWGGSMGVCFAACWAFGRFKARRGPDSVWRFV